jgi:hypothetical protein
MDAEIKTKWVEALRSGEYDQARGVLHDRDNGGFCCLGVLCKVIGAAFGPGSEEREDREYGPYTEEYDYVPVLNGRVISNHEDDELSPPFCKEIGIPDQGILIHMNDGSDDESPKSFAEIADYIEREL